MPPPRSWCSWSRRSTPAPAGGLRARTRARRDLGPALAARLDPLVPAHPAAAVEVLATRPRAVPVEHHIGPHAPRAARTDGARVRERREGGLLGGGGRHARGGYHLRAPPNPPPPPPGPPVLPSGTPPASRGPCAPPPPPSPAR